MQSYQLDRKESDSPIEVMKGGSLSTSLDDSIKLITNFARPKEKSDEGVLPVYRKDDVAEEEDVGFEGLILPVEDKESKENDVEMEVKDFKEFEVILKELKLAVLNSYSQGTDAEKKKIEIFVNKFNTAIQVITKQKEQLNYTESKSALDAALSAAKECKSIWEKIETGVSPIAYVVGGLVGFIIGIPVGAIVGILGLLYILGKSNAPPPTDPLLLKICLITAMAIGAVCGAILGAAEGSKRVHSYSQRFFKPSVTVNDAMSKFITCNSFINEILEKRAIAEATNLPTVLVDIITSYREKSASLATSSLNIGTNSIARATRSH